MEGRKKRKLCIRFGLLALYDSTNFEYTSLNSECFCIISKISGTLLPVTKPFSVAIWC